MSASTEETRATVSRYVEAFNTANLDSFAKVFASYVVDHNPPSGQAPGLDGIKQTFIMMNAAFPDGHITIEDVIAEGDRVAVRMTIRATHQGELMGLAPTGSPVAMTRISIFRIAGGKIVEWWHNEDTLGMMRQLGLVPSG
jgi:predicted ester cyclase